MKDHDDQPQPQPQPHGAGFDDAYLQRSDRRGARTFSGRAPSAPARRSESPRLSVCSGEAAASALEPKTMFDDTDRPDAEDLTFPELGHGPPGPPEPPDDWRTWGEAEWRAHDAKIKRKIDEEVDAELDELKALQRERDPPG